MSTRGFNENELVKTIITQIDKDGFNKKTVLYGEDARIGGGAFEKATVTFACSTNSSYECMPSCVILDGVIDTTMSYNSSAKVLSITEDSPVSIDIPLGDNGASIEVVFKSVESSDIHKAGNVTIVSTQAAGQDTVAVLTVTGDGTISVTKVS